MAPGGSTCFSKVPRWINKVLKHAQTNWIETRGYHNSLGLMLLLGTLICHLSSPTVFLQFARSDNQDSFILGKAAPTVLGSCIDKLDQGCF